MGVPSDSPARPRVDSQTNQEPAPFNSHPLFLSRLVEPNRRHQESTLLLRFSLLLLILAHLSRPPFALGAPFSPFSHLPSALLFEHFSQVFFLLITLVAPAIACVARSFFFSSIIIIPVSRIEQLRYNRVTLPTIQQKGSSYERRPIKSPRAHYTRGHFRS